MVYKFRRLDDVWVRAKNYIDPVFCEKFGPVLLVIVGRPPILCSPVDDDNCPLGVFLGVGNVFQNLVFVQGVYHILLALNVAVKTVEAVSVI